jgi:hypothetical protein
MLRSTYETKRYLKDYPDKREELLKVFDIFASKRKDEADLVMK